MDEDKTLIFDSFDIDEKETHDKLKIIYDNLLERGYNPVNQIVGYIISGDLGYISSYKDSRKIMSELDRSMLTELLLRNFLS